MSPNHQAPDRTVAVVGLGQMGQGIAQVCAEAGCQVLVFDADNQARDRGRERITARWRKAFDAGELTTPLDVLQSRIVPATQDALEQVEVFIEAVTEELSAKEKLLADFGSRVDPRAIVATNTSSISITRLAAAVPHPQRVVGLHFMNPVPKMKLVELIRGLQTDAATVTAAGAFARELGKEVVEVNDAPGFAVNRLAIPLINEACFALEQGVAAAEAIDSAAKLGLNHPMGPLALADLIGLDTVLAIAEVLHRDFGEDKYRPCPLLRRYVAAGQLGRKSGRGFYDYAEGRP